MKKAKNILVITYWSFADALVQTYTLPYLRIIRDLLPEGSSLFLVTLEKENASSTPLRIEDGIFRISFPSIPFGWKAIVSWRKNISFLKLFTRTHDIDTIHTWCSPAGAIGYLLSKRTGLPLILDSYEPHAEPMVETGTWKKGGIAFRLLFYLEKKQTHRATYLIGVVRGMKDYAKLKYHFSGENFFTKPACIDVDQFNLSKRKDEKLIHKYDLADKIVCVYAAKFGGLYLEKDQLTFLDQAFQFFGYKLKVLFLSSTPEAEIENMCRTYGWDPQNVKVLFVPHAEMSAHLGLGDFAFSPFKPVPSRKYCTPIKNGEYWAMGLPVVIYNGISDDSDIISKNDVGSVLKDSSPQEAMESVLHISELILQNKDGKLSEKIHQLAVKHRNFKIAEDIYRKIYGV